MEANLSATIVWAIIGLALIIAEMFTATFILMFFGASAIIVSLLTFIGLTQLWMQLVLFSVLSIIGLILFRKRLVSTLSNTRDLPLDEKQKIILSSAIPARSFAQIQYQGSTWTAYNETDTDFHSGDAAVINRIDGIKIMLRREV